MVTSEFYSEDYYERGLETGKSNYQNYRWIPELTVPFAMSLIDFLEINREHSVLEIGCAKGFLVKGFRWLHRRAWGVDISTYAVENCDPEVKRYIFHTEECCRVLAGEHYDWCIGKDVWEHNDVPVLKELLLTIPARNLFSIIPLAENGKYNAFANELDASHIIRENAEWWRNFFAECNWKETFFAYKLDGMKEAYRHTPKAHLFITHERI